MLSPHMLGLLSSNHKDNDYQKRNSLCLRRGSMPSDNSSLSSVESKNGATTNRRGSMFVTTLTHAFADSQERLAVQKPQKIIQHEPERRRSSPTATSSTRKSDEHTKSSPENDNTGTTKKSSGGLKQMFNRLTSMVEATPLVDSSGIEVHGYSNNPTEAWEWLKSANPIVPMKLRKPVYPTPDDVARFVCMSDTHGRPINPQHIPNGDVLIVAGDFTSYGHPQEIKAFNDFLGELPHPYKLVVCGNHELTFDHNWTPVQSLFPGIEKMLKMDRVGAARCVFREALKQANVINPRQLLSNCTLLEDSGVTLFDLKIFGSPWMPKFDDWAYNLPRGKPLLEKWNAIPTNTDILITHTPPLGCCDMTKCEMRAGCVELLNTVRKRVQPKYHIFGHIHEGYGCATDGRTKFINSCLLNTDMKMINMPLVFDIPLNTEHPKSYYLRSEYI